MRSHDMMEMPSNSLGRQTLTPVMGFREAASIIWKRKNLVLVVATAFVVAAAAAAWLMRPVYRAEMLLMPVNRDGMQSGVAGLMSQFSGLASLAGIGPNDSGSSAEHIAFMQSQQFLSDFIEANDIMSVLFPEYPKAAKESPSRSNDAPTLQDAYTMFVERIMTVERDRETGIVTLAVEWGEPSLAAKWAKGLVYTANEELRHRAIDESNAMLAYLQSELERSHLMELRTAIYSLLESQLNTVMLANGRQQYAFRVISPAIAPDPDHFVRPKRALMVVIGAFIGFSLGALLALTLSTWRHP